MASISKKIESTLTSTSTQLAAALVQFATAVGSALTTWQTQQALPNCSANVQRQYCDVLVKRQIKTLTCNDAVYASSTQYSNVTPTALSSDYAASATHKSNDSEVIANSDNDDNQCSEVSEEVTGTIPAPKFNMD